MAHSTLWLLGGPGVTAEAGTVEGAQIPGRQGRVALAYLIWSHPRWVPRTELAAVLWDEHAPSDVPAAIATVISRLRSALPDGLVIDAADGSYRLSASDEIMMDVEQLVSDLARAREALDTGDRLAAAEGASRVVEAARHPLCPGLDGEWLVEARRRVRTLLVEGLEVLAAASSPVEAVGHAEEAVALEPFREAAYRRLIEAHLAAGNRAEALRAYERCRRVLAEELGVDPSPETEDAYLRGLRLGGPAEAFRRLPLPGDMPAQERGPLIGRGRELEALARAARPGLLLVTGDPGIGKTRLVTEYAADRHRQGEIVLFGRCDEEQVGPYQPFVQALRHLIRALPPEPVSALTGPWAPDLSRLLPELHDRVPGLTSPMAASADTERLRLYEAISAVLGALSEQQPCVLIVDDLQWGDRSTVRLLRHVLRAARGLPLQVLATCREGEVTDDHPVVEVLHDLSRDGLVTRTALANLTMEDVAALLVGREEHAAAVHETTAGNPFYVRQLARHLDETDSDPQGAGVPPAVHDVVRRRLARLDNLAQQLLIVASVFGRQAELPLVARVAGLDEDASLTAIEQSASSGLVVETDGGRIGFGHDLVREAVYQRLGPTRRRRLHRWAGEALERMRPGEPGEIARHLRLSADPGDADLGARMVEATLRAAAAASRKLGYDEAARHCEQALTVASDPEHVTRLLLALAEARDKVGDGRAQQTFRDAAASARATGDAALLARAAIGLAATWGWTGVIEPDRIELLEEALGGIGEGDTTLRAQLLARMACELVFEKELDHRESLAGESVAIARRVGEPGALGWCLEARSYALWVPGRGDRRLATAEEICRLAEEAGEQELGLAGHAWGITAGFELGEPGTLDRHLASYAAIADRLRQPRHRWYGMSRRAVHAAARGEFERAVRLAESARRVAEEAGEPDARNVYTGNMLMVWLERRDPHAVAALEALLEELEPVLPPDCGPLLGIRGYAFLAHLSAGDVGRARELLDRVPADGLRDVLPDMEWTDFMASNAWAAVRLGDLDRAAVVAELLAPYADYAAVDSGGVVFMGAISFTLGMLATALGDHAVAEHHLEAALAFHERLHAKPWIGRTRFEQARLERARGRRAAAEELLDEAEGIADRVGMTWLRDDIATERAL